MPYNAKDTYWDVDGRRVDLDMELFGVVITEGLRSTSLPGAEPEVDRVLVAGEQCLEVFSQWQRQPCLLLHATLTPTSLGRRGVHATC